MTAPIDRLNAALTGRYAIERELGEGGMATVYLADDVRHERKVALKVLKPELAAIVGAERFLAEIKTTANLQHPHILPLHDSGEADGFLFYVMPYVEGESLRQKLDREHQLPVDEAVRIAENVGEALDYAHRHGVIHRDIKPANILLQDGKPVVSDFGIALALGTAGGGRLTETGLSLGTPHYMSPEQATGDLSIGPATDVYALGCVLYEMLVGEPPYTGSTPQAVLGKIVTGEPRSVTEERSTVPAHVDAVVRRALEKVPADRFGTAGEMARALGDVGFRWGEGAVASFEALRSRAWSPLSVALGFAAVVMAAGWSWSAMASVESDLPTRRSALLLPHGRTVASSTSQAVSISAYGTRVAFRVFTQAGDGEVYVRDLAQASEVYLSAAGGGAGSVTLSPDGAWIAYHDATTREVKRAPTAGGPAETLGPTGMAEGGAFRGLSYGADGSIVFGTQSGLRRLRDVGGTPEVVTTLDPEGPIQHRDAVFLPDGTGVVFTENDARSTEQRVMVQRFEASEPEPLTQGHSPHITPEGVLLYGTGGWRDHRLSAVRLTADWSTVLGDPVTVLEGISEMQVAAETPSLRYSLSDEGTLVYLPELERPGQSYVLADREGNLDTVLSMDDPQFPPGVQSMGPPRISPDGSRIAFRASFFQPADPLFRVFTFDLGRRLLTPVLVDWNADWPVWTADGERVAFNRWRGADQNLYWARVDGSGPPEPLIGPNAHQQHAQEFSRDGRFLVYNHREEPNDPDTDIWLLTMDATSEQRVLVDGDGFQRNPSISPDGRLLAFESNESGGAEVYVTEFPDSRTSTRVSVNGGRSPVWSPSGGELYYISSVGPTTVVSVSVSAAGGGLDIGSPTVAAEGPFNANNTFGRPLDVHPDDERLLLLWLGDETVDVPRIELFQGFLTHVGERLGN